MAGLKIEQTNDGVVFTAKIVPGSSRTALCGLLDGMLKVKIAAAPEKQKANGCLCEFLAKKIGVKKKDVSVVSGKTSSIKKIKISGQANPAIPSALLRTRVLAGLTGISK